MDAIIKEVKFNDDGLVPVIAQDATDGRVLMLAWANQEALEETIQTGYGTYFSRSRQKLWRKGEESGNRQKISSIQLDCDGDAILYLVEQIGGIACHTGRKSCFYRILKDGRWVVNEAIIRNPEDMYRHS
ncbi:MAG: phosphoribosyl-AMP cyclohydrolase [Burkholderiaceae bacterium]|nr:phosphoribosyl-AMP cyclohydrolase [Burkholderiaceae bacterium]